VSKLIKHLEALLTEDMQLFAKRLLAHEIEALKFIIRAKIDTALKDKNIDSLIQKDFNQKYDDKFQAHVIRQQRYLSSENKIQRDELKRELKDWQAYVEKMHKNQDFLLERIEELERKLNV
jgi:hypothetical protein